MGLFSSLFGKSKPKPTQHHVTGLVASMIDYILINEHIDSLGKRSLALRRDFSIELGNKTTTKGGDILAVAHPNKLEGFAEWNNFLHELLANRDEKFRRRLMETGGSGSRIVDQISRAVTSEFESQSTEFERLNPGGFLDDYME